MRTKGAFEVATNGAKGLEDSKDDKGSTKATTSMTKGIQEMKDFIISPR